MVSQQLFWQLWAKCSLAVKPVGSMGQQTETMNAHIWPMRDFHSAALLPESSSRMKSQWTDIGVWYHGSVGGTIYSKLQLYLLDCGCKTLANSGGRSFLSKVVNLDSACVTNEHHIALCLATHAVCPGRDCESISSSFACQNCSWCLKNLTADSISTWRHWSSLTLCIIWAFAQSQCTW